MRKVFSYDIEEIVPYINWLYFYHAWDLNGKPEDEKEKIKDEAEGMLMSWNGKYHVHAIVGIYDANSDGDDLLIGDVRIPMLRQQKIKSENDYFLCLTDFVRPLSLGIKDKVGVFCTSVDSEVTKCYEEDAYKRMLSQVLCDRLAEGAAEKLHEDVRRIYWGYAPDEHLTMQQTHNEEYQGIRPAIGYPSLPDTSVNFILDDLLVMKDVGIRLTQSGMMNPHASVSGFMFSHPKSRYFDLGPIGEDQLRDYARRRGLPLELMRRFLESSLLKK